MSVSRYKSSVAEKKKKKNLLSNYALFFLILFLAMRVREYLILQFPSCGSSLILSL